MEVIATIWKKPYYTDRNQRMIDAGVDYFRIKCSHWGIDDIIAALKLAREQIDVSGREVKLLADLPEAKVRLGKFEPDKIMLETGKEYTFASAESSSDIEQFIPVALDSIGNELEVGDQFFIGDGQILFEVTKIINPWSFAARTHNAGLLIASTSLTSPRILAKLNHVTPVLDEILSRLSESRPDAIAFSFVDSGATMRLLLEKLSHHTNDSWNPRVIAKIESQAGIDNADEILDLADGIMVARGDLGLNIDYARLGLVQKILVDKARAKNKYVIVSTQVLQSILGNFLPMRSDILDVTNACLDGASAVMLCAETAHNETPERAVTVAKRIVAEVRKSQEKSANISTRPLLIDQK